MHVTSGTTGTPKGVYSGLLTDDRRCRAGRRGARPVGLPPGRRQPGAQPALPLCPAAVRDGHVVGRRQVEHPRAGSTRPPSPPRSSGTGRPRCSACPPICSGSSPTGTTTGWPDLGCFRLVAHAGAPCPDRPQAPADRDAPARLDLGVLRLHRGAVHRLPQRGVARAARHRRAGPARAPAEHRPGRHDLVLRCPSTRASSTSGRRRRRQPPGEPPPTGGARSPSATTGGSTMTATSTSTVAART